MGLILNSSILINAERRVETISGLLRRIRETTEQSEVAISAISVIEFEHGIWRADTLERAEKRRIYPQEIYAAIRVEPFTREMGELAARIDAEGKKTGQVIPFADLQIGMTALELGHAIADSQCEALCDDSWASDKATMSPLPARWFPIVPFGKGKSKNKSV